MHTLRDPRPCLLSLLPASFCIALSTKISTAALALLFSIRLAFWVGLSLVEIARRVRLVLGLLVFVVILIPWMLPGDDTAWFAWTWHGFETALLLATKILALAVLWQWPGAVYSWNALAEGLQRLRLPGPVIQILLLSVRYTFVLREEWSRLRTALAVRAFRNQSTYKGYRTWGLVVGQLLLRTHDHADRLSHALRCRGYRGQVPHLEEIRIAKLDVIQALLVIVVTICLLIWDHF